MIGASVPWLYTPTAKLRTRALGGVGTENSGPGALGIWVTSHLVWPGASLQTRELYPWESVVGLCSSLIPENDGDCRAVSAVITGHTCTVIATSVTTKW